MGKVGILTKGTIEIIKGLFITNKDYISQLVWDEEIVFKYEGTKQLNNDLWALYNDNNTMNNILFIGASIEILKENGIEKFYSNEEMKNTYKVCEELNNELCDLFLTREDVKVLELK